MSWYFAYGSNMSAARLFDERLVPEGVPAGERVAGRLDGWRLAFNKRARSPAGSGAGNIVVAENASVFGTLNQLSAAGFAVLDRCEGVAGGHYERRTVSVARLDNGEPVEAITYVALLTGADLRPTRAYLAHLLAGRDMLPADYVRWLAATPTVD
ncbi:MAG: gamma-glutamylcyclotransferase family protein [Reyranella sp.]|uniref:gamma-glutamylcyclotransferase family protein n=1 Tax=Reyranella sp. TaxID=1929291 RepID=UPI003D0D8631